MFPLPLYHGQEYLSWLEDLEAVIYVGITLTDSGQGVDNRCNVGFKVLANKTNNRSKWLNGPTSPP